jgi:hypothetical protein
MPTVEEVAAFCRERKYDVVGVSQHYRHFTVRVSSRKRMTQSTLGKTFDGTDYLFVRTEHRPENLHSFVLKWMG